MINRIVWYLSITVTAIACCRSAASAGIVTSNDLEVSVDVHSNAITQNSPGVITFRVKNISPEPMQVLIPCLGSMDVAEAARASVVVSIVDPRKKSMRINYAKPFIGPMREVEYVKISPTTLKPNQELTANLIIGGSWSPGQERPIFTHEGQYSVSLSYCPFVVTDTAGRLQVDRSREIHIPEFVIMVSMGDSEDASAWEQIQKLKHWWILYDPEMRNVKYLSDAEQQELGDALAKLTRDHGKSSYRKYLEYGAVALQTVRVKKGGVVPSDAVVKLDNLANDRGFAYRSYAQEVHNRVKQ